MKENFRIFYEDLIKLYKIIINTFCVGNYCYVKLSNLEEKFSI